MQIMLVYFGLPASGLNIDRLTAAVVALGLNSAAYSGEIFRAGIESIDKGTNGGCQGCGYDWKYGYEAHRFTSGFPCGNSPFS